MSINIDYYLQPNLNSSVNKRLDKITEGEFVKRLWNKDFTLWSDTPDEITNRLDWLTSPKEMIANIMQIDHFVTQVKNEAFEKIVLLGMGGSSLSSEVFKKSFTNQEGYPDLEILDTTHPDWIAKIEASLDPSKVLFIVATKSGGTIETISLFKYFYNWLSLTSGIKNVGNQFVAITDSGSKLEDIAKEFNFREVFINNPNIGGRYSVLSYFGLVPASLIGIELKDLLAAAIKFSTDLKSNFPNEENPGIKLGAFLGEAALQGYDKATFILSDTLISFGDWVEQLIAESTGKEGKGILPLVGEEFKSTEKYSNDRIFILIDFEANHDLGEFQTKLIENNHSVVVINISDIYELGGLFYIWEIATSLAGYILEINPFDQPNVESAKILSRELVNNRLNNNEFSKWDYQKFDKLSLNNFLDSVKEGDYIAVQAYIPQSNENFLLMNNLRTYLLEKYNLATTVGFGPRYLHSTGQLHKGDKGNGHFLQFIAKPENDLDIPDKAGANESSITFGNLMSSQADGDAQALINNGRKVITFIFDQAELSSLAHPED